MNRGRAGLGRPKGSLNKTTRELKDMILHALEEAGGVEYRVKQAKKNPGAFLVLVGKVLPLTVAGDGDHPIEHRVTFGGRYKPSQ